MSSSVDNDVISMLKKLNARLDSMDKNLKTNNRRLDAMVNENQQVRQRLTYLENVEPEEREANNQPQ